MEKKFYANINSLNNIDIEVICDGETIYAGNSNEADETVKTLRYFDIELGSPTKVYVAKQEN